MKDRKVFWGSVSWTFGVVFWRPGAANIVMMKAMFIGAFGSMGLLVREARSRIIGGEGRTAREQSL
jgi:hypothetical protein